MLEDNEEPEEGQTEPSYFSWLLVAGVVLVFVGALVIFAAAASSGGSASSGVVIFIGPIPIAFGSGPDAALLIVAGAVLAAVAVALFVVMRRRMLSVTV